MRKKVLVSLLMLLLAAPIINAGEIQEMPENNYEEGVITGMVIIGEGSIFRPAPFIVSWRITDGWINIEFLNNGIFEGTSGHGCLIFPIGIVVAFNEVNIGGFALYGYAESN